MLGNLIFPFAQYLVWQDTKFRYLVPKYWFGHGYFHLINHTLQTANVCAAYVGLPNHRHTIGAKKKHISLRDEGFQKHCNVLSGSKRKGVSDSQKDIQKQCADYKQYIMQALNSTSILSSMIDSAFFVRDMHTEKCKHFNSEVSINLI